MFYNFRTNFDHLCNCLPFILKRIKEYGYLTSKIVVGFDGYESSRKIMLYLINLLESDYEIINSGICSTPALAFYCKRHSMCGIMVTASHCSDFLSGMKIFKKDGFMIPIHEEENIISSVKSISESIIGVANISKIKSSKDNFLDFNSHEEYFNVLKNIRMHINEKISWVVYTSMFSFVSSIFNQYGDTIIASDQADPESRLFNYSKNGYVVSVDADIDKCIIYYNGIRINENYIILSLLNHFEAKTLVSNRELHIDMNEFFSNSNITCKYVRVGDQFILDYLNRYLNRSNMLGAEPNGHYILPNQTCADGILSALHFIRFNLKNQKKVNFFQSKVVFKYEDVNLREDEFDDLKRNDCIWNDGTEIMIFLRGDLCFARLSMWESSIVAITFGDRCKNNMDYLIEQLHGTVTRRIDYVEVQN